MKGLISLMLLACVSVPAFAQEAGQDGEAEQPAAGAPTPEEQAAEREALEPGVPSAVLAQDVRRRANGAGGVMDEMQLGRTEITGNRELPKVLYIVPWKQSDPGDLMGRPVNTLLDEVLTPLDREEFIRRVEYYGDLYEEQQE
ncbi:MAG: hypothetical protein ACE5FV_06430 [Woeseia sp.]